MENKKQQTAEQQLREIADKAGMTLRDLNQMFQRAYIDDEKTRSRIIEQQKQEMAIQQNQLMGLQYRNETMSNQLLTYQLGRKIKWVQRKQWVMSLFTKKKKA